MGKALDTIRRELDYYRPNFLGSLWAGWTMPETLPGRPDVGPDQVSRARGIAMIGAQPWVAMYNVPILSTDVSAARRIARAVSARGGGLPTVQTLGLVHGEDSTEIACMLLEPNQVGADRVQNQIEVLAAQDGLDVERGYFTDLSPDMIVERYLNLVSDWCESSASTWMKTSCSLCWSCKLIDWSHYQYANRSSFLHLESSVGFILAKAKLLAICMNYYLATKLGMQSLSLHTQILSVLSRAVLLEVEGIKGAWQLIQGQIINLPGDAVND